MLFLWFRRRFHRLPPISNFRCRRFRSKSDDALFLPSKKRRGILPSDWPLYTSEFNFESHNWKHHRFIDSFTIIFNNNSSQIKPPYIANWQWWLSSCFLLNYSFNNNEIVGASSSLLALKIAVSGVSGGLLPAERCIGFVSHFEFQWIDDYCTHFNPFF